MKPNTTLPYWILLLSFILSGHAETMAQHTVQVINNATKQPLEGVNWEFGSQHGFSDQEGCLYFFANETDTLFLSHVNYGQWQLYGPALQEALQKGSVERAEQVVVLQPLTVLSFHTNSGNLNRFRMGAQDRLSHDAGALLTQTPAIAVIRKSGSYGFDPVLRGFKYDQLNVVIDGVQCASAACPNRMDPPISQVAPNMIEQVELLKGPYSLRFGNSFGGTINFKSPEPRFVEATRSFGRLSGSYEANGQIGRSEGLVGFRGKRYELSLLGGYSTGNDYKDGDGQLVPAKFSRGSVGANLAWSLNNGQLLSTQVARNFARDTDFPALPMDLRTDDTWLVNIAHRMSFEHQIFQHLSTKIYYTGVNHLMDNLSKEITPRMLDATTTAQTLNYGGRTEAELKVQNGKLYIGADFREEEVEGIRQRSFLMGPMAGKTVYDNPWQKARHMRTAVFSEYQKVMENFMLVVSGRVELNHSDALQADETFAALYPSLTNTQINPGLSVGGTNRYDNGLSLGLWLGHTRRSGGITEHYINFFPVGIDPYEMLGNPELLPEENSQIDFKLNYQSGGTLVDLTLFSAFLNNYISSVIVPDISPRLPASPGVRQYTNIGTALLSGFELSWTQPLFAGMFHQMAVAYTYGENKMNNSPLPEIPPLDLRYVLSGHYLENTLKPEISLRHVWKQERIATSFGESVTPGFTLVDLLLSYQPKNYISISAGVQNLMDKAYYEHLSRSVANAAKRKIYAPGRNIYLRLSLLLP